jgi:hypothetical protein
MIELEPEALALFWSKVAKTRGCWLWVGLPTTKGYGRCQIAGRNLLAHRISYTLLKGAIPKGLLVCHKCDNRLCVRPAHLFLGTVLDNNRDCAAKQRNCGPRNVGEENPLAKLTTEKVREIRRSSESGKSLAARFGIAQSVVSNVRKRKLWTHVSD